MKYIYLLALLVSFLNSASGQSAKYNLKHLTKEDYVRQIELCADSAYADAGMPGVQSTYDENTYDWVVGHLDEVINKHFSSTITHDADKEADIDYNLIWYRDKKNLSIGLNFLFRGKPIGQTYVLFGILTEDSVQGIIKIFSSKKEIKKIFQDGVK